MEIQREDIDFFKFPKEIFKLALAPYLEMPTGEHPFSMQHHWRGRSVHVDWRMKVNGYLVGWTVLDNPKGTPKVETIEEAERALKSVPFIFKHTSTNQGRRAETKARQPIEWMKVHGVTKPGDPGATRENVGVIYKFETGSVIFGVQKPYFHEYFVKSATGRFFPKNQWFRIVVRRVGVPALDPETKKPLEKREVLWRVLIPGTQEPYAISDRAMKRNYKPPKSNSTPFPVEWTKKNFTEQYQEWEEWKKGGKEEKTCRTCYKLNMKLCNDPETLSNPDRLACENWIHVDLIRSFESLPFAGYKNFADCVRKNKDKDDPNAYCAFIARQVGEIKSLSPARFVLHFNSWMGQFVVRGVPKREWYLRIEDDGLRTFYFEKDPLYYRPTSAEDQGKVDKKWLTFEGKIAPRTKYNPNKRIPAVMKIVDKGTVQITKEKEEEVEIINLVFSGKELKGKWRLVQEEKKAPTYNFEKLSEELTKLDFVLQKHWIPVPGKKEEFPEGYDHHWDVRFSNGLEFNLYKDPIETKEEEEIKSKRKTYSPDRIKPWIAIAKQKTPMKVGPLNTLVDPIDKGKAEIFEINPNFVSMKFHGSKLNGYFVWRKKEDIEVFLRSRLPSTSEQKGDVFDKYIRGFLEIVKETKHSDEDLKLDRELKEKKLIVLKKFLEENEENVESS